MTPIKIISTFFLPILGSSGNDFLCLGIEVWLSVSITGWGFEFSSVVVGGLALKCLTASQHLLRKLAMLESHIMAPPSNFDISVTIVELTYLLFSSSIGAVS